MRNTRQSAKQSAEVLRAGTVTGAESRESGTKTGQKTGEEGSAERRAGLLDTEVGGLHAVAAG